jgi:hypothetical protein
LFCNRNGRDYRGYVVEAVFVKEGNMKLEVNLNDVFRGENGESVNEIIQDAVITRLTEEAREKIRASLEQQLSEVISSELHNRIGAFIESILPQMLDHEFTETTSWGEKKGTYTVRNRILKHLDEMMVFKTGGYHSDNNAVTRAVEEVVEKRIKDFAAGFNKVVDEKFTSEAMAMAEKRLRERLGIKF